SPHNTRATIEPRGSEVVEIAQGDIVVMRHRSRWTCGSTTALLVDEELPMNRSRESVRPSHVIGCVLASLILGCASTAEPVYTLSDRGYKNNLSKADSYCIRAEEEVRPKGGSSTLEFVGLIGMITG